MAETIYDIAQTSDGGYIAAGEKYSVNTFEDIYVVKLTASGEMEWEQKYIASKEDYANSIKQTSDGGYIVCGGTYTNTEGVSDFYMLKLDPAGEVEWEQKSGGNERDVCEAIIQTKDGGYLAAGDTWLNFYDSDIFLIKIDPNGNIEWDLNIGGGEEDGAYDVQQTPDNGYIIAGYTRSISDLSYVAYIAKTDPDGAVEWKKEFGGSGNDQFYSITQQDNGYVAAGYTESFNELSDIYVVKVNLDGEKVWEKVYGEDETQEDARSIKRTSDGGFILAGKTNEYSYGSFDMYLIKLCRNGTLEWSQVFGGQYNDIGYSVLQSSDEGYVIAGQTKSLGGGGDAYIVKTEGTEESTLGKNISKNLPEYGSPANGILISILILVITGLIIKRKL
ncbi:MAG: hypothetical protein GWP12_00760 [Nitrospirae bacterium]|nr:hypothetical protein [Nitrospirota bacterium]